MTTRETLELKSMTPDTFFEIEQQFDELQKARAASDPMPPIPYWAMACHLLATEVRAALDAQDELKTLQLRVDILRERAEAAEAECAVLRGALDEALELGDFSDFSPEGVATPDTKDATRVDYLFDFVRRAAEAKAELTTLRTQHAALVKWLAEDIDRSVDVVGRVATLRDVLARLRDGVQEPTK